MKFHDFETKSVKLSSLDDTNLITSKLMDGTFVASVMGTGIQVSTGGPTRGHAILELQQHLRDLATELGKIAFETEGAVRVPR